MKPEALQIIHKMRDHEIINSFHSLIPAFEHKVRPEQFKRLVSLSLSQPEALWSLYDPEVDLPVIKSDNISARDGIIDPATGQTVPLNRSLAEWGVFQELLLKETVENVDEKAFLVIAQTLGIFRKNHTGLETQLFVARLWEHRWIYDSEGCANWLLAAIAQSPLDIVKIVKDGNEAQRIFQDLELRLNQAKDSVMTLNDWFEQLYLVLPLAKYGRLLYKTVQTNDGEKRLRFLEEVIADIETIYLHGMYMLLDAIPPEPFFWGLHPPTRKLSIDELKETIRQLSYGYRARVKYPRFWFDEVCEHLQFGDEIPTSIGRFDFQRLVSIFITNWPKVASQVFTGVWPSLPDDFVMTF